MPGRLEFNNAPQPYLFDVSGAFQTAANLINTPLRNFRDVMNDIQGDIQQQNTNDLYRYLASQFDPNNVQSINEAIRNAAASGKYSNVADSVWSTVADNFRQNQYKQLDAQNLALAQRAMDPYQNEINRALANGEIQGGVNANNAAAQAMRAGNYRSDAIKYGDIDPLRTSASERALRGAQADSIRKAAARQAKLDESSSKLNEFMNMYLDRANTGNLTGNSITANEILRLADSDPSLTSEDRFKLRTWLTSGKSNPYHTVQETTRGIYAQPVPSELGNSNINNSSYLNEGLGYISSGSQVSDTSNANGNFADNMIQDRNNSGPIVSPTINTTERTAVFNPMTGATLSGERQVQRENPEYVARQKADNELSAAVSTGITATNTFGSQNIRNMPLGNQVYAVQANTSVLNNLANEASGYLNGMLESNGNSAEMSEIHKMRTGHGKYQTPRVQELLTQYSTDKDGNTVATKRASTKKNLVDAIVDSKNLIANEFWGDRDPAEIQENIDDNKRLVSDIFTEFQGKGLSGELIAYVIDSQKVNRASNSGTWSDFIDADGIRENLNRIVESFKPGSQFNKSVETVSNLQAANDEISGYAQEINQLAARIEDINRRIANGVATYSDLNELQVLQKQYNKAMDNYQAMNLWFNKSLTGNTNNRNN